MLMSLSRAILAVAAMSLLAATGKSAEEAMLLGHIKLGSSSSAAGPIRFSANAKEIFHEFLTAERKRATGTGTPLSTLLATRHLTLTGPDRRTYDVQWLQYDDAADAEAGSLVWFVDGSQVADARGRYGLWLHDGAPTSKLTYEEKEGRRFLVSSNGKSVLRYNHGVVRQRSDREGPYDRACYLHPIWTPSGAIVTGDFSPEHIHQRGLFTAWVKAQFGDVSTDFWGLGSSQGRILPGDAPPRIVAGPICTTLSFENKGVVGERTVLDERVDITVYADSYEDGWLFDIRTTQVPVGTKMELPKVYYGGTSFRGPAEWLARSSKDVQRAMARGVSFDGMKWLPPDLKLDVVTSDGNDRITGDRKPARWIDFTGPRGAGWGGVAMFDSPANPRFPTPLRIHPGLPYFSYAFVQQEAFALAAGAALSLHYRVYVHDGRPDSGSNEKIAEAYRNTPKLTWHPLN